MCPSAAVIALPKSWDDTPSWYPKEKRLFGGRGPRYGLSGASGGAVVPVGRQGLSTLQPIAFWDAGEGGMTGGPRALPLHLFPYLPLLPRSSCSWLQPRHFDDDRPRRRRAAHPPARGHHEPRAAQRSRPRRRPAARAGPGRGQRRRLGPRPDARERRVGGRRPAGVQARAAGGARRAGELPPLRLPSHPCLLSHPVPPARPPPARRATRTRCSPTSGRSAST